MPDLSPKLITKLFRWRRKLIVSGLFGAISGILLSLLSPPEYRSVAVVFPSKNLSVSKLLLEPNIGKQEDYMQPENAEDARNLLQMLQSDDLKLLVANSDHLWQRWKIKDTVYRMHALNKAWTSKVHIAITEYSGIEVSVTDESPEAAAALANSIVSYCDTIKYKMNRRIAHEALLITKKEYDNTEKFIGTLSDSIEFFRQKGILNYKTDVKEYTRALLRSVASGNKQGEKKLSKRLDTLKKYGTTVNDLNEKLKGYMAKYPVIRMKYEDALVNYNNVLPASFRVQKAIPDPHKNNWNMIWIILVSILLFSFITLVALLVFNNLKERIKVN
jgi:LPS O-antigen subunit length determinant protein (WzzB/FepE family)